MSTCNLVLLLLCHLNNRTGYFFSRTYLYPQLCFVLAQCTFIGRISRYFLCPHFTPFRAKNIFQHYMVHTLYLEQEEHRLQCCEGMERIVLCKTSKGIDNSKLYTVSPVKLFHHWDTYMGYMLQLIWIIS